MTEKQFERLLASYLDGSLSDDEIVALKDAVQEVPSYRHRFQNEVRLHTLLREVTVEKVEEEKITKRRRRRPVPTMPKRKPIMAVVLAAAAAIVVVGLITAIIAHNQPESVGICMHVTDDGQAELIRAGKSITLQKNQSLFEGDRVLNADRGRTMLFLNDGSMLSLEQETELVLSETRQTQVTLRRGEILLEVAKRKAGQEPFRVGTTDATMTVLGTVFSVSADTQATRLSVYEGKVQLDRASDSRRTLVEANQFTVTSDPALKTLPLEAVGPDVSQSDVLQVLPTDDVCTQGSRIVNSPELRVMGTERVTYLRFQLKNVGSVKRAVLHMTQSIDPGSGTLTFHLGDHANWTERNLTYKDVPRAKQLLAVRKGAVVVGETIEVDLSKGIKGDGVYTIIVKLDLGDAHDIWFSSKEGAHPPKLHLTR